MINPSFKELSEISSSRYEVCIMVMKRARLLTDGSKPKIKSKGKKPVTVALDEIMAREVVKKKSTLEEEPVELAVDIETVEAVSEEKPASETADEAGAVKKEEE